MGPPSSSDAAHAKEGNPAKLTFESTFASPHTRVRQKDGALLGLNDGRLPRNEDDPQRSTYFDGGPARMFVDMGRSVPINRVDTYSWHRADRAPQRFLLWGSTAEARPSASGDLVAAGWTPIAQVDTSPLGWGGKHGSSISGAKGPLGTFRHLLYDLSPIWKDQGAFLAEIDVWVAGEAEPQPLKSPAYREELRPLCCALATGTDATLEVLESPEGRRLVLRIPPGDGTRHLTLAYTRDLRDPGMALAAAPSGNASSSLVLGILSGPSLYPETVTVQGKRAEDGDAPWVVDDIPIPFENPWGSYMRIGGFDFFSDGTRAAVCTWNGDVWIVSGLDDDLADVTWRRYATGLFETLGLKIVDDVVYVNGKDQITRLHDLNGDGEADYYECFNNDVLTTRNFHEFTFDLQTDAAGNFYMSKAAPVKGGGRGFDAIIPHHGTVMKVSSDGSSLEVYARGMRAPNGIGVSPDGQVTCGDNEGTWVPHCKLHWLQPGSFQGVVDVAHADEPPKDFNKPLCWFPMEVDNSGGGQVWVTDDRWGPYGGDLLHLSYGQSAVYKVMKEVVDGQIQGGVFRIPVQFASSAMRGRFNPRDGQLWVCGLQGWQTNAAKLSGFQRVRYTGAPVRLPKELRVRPEGVEIAFTCELDRELAEDTESYAVEQWNYVWGPQYGSPEISVAEPDPEILEKSQKTEMHGYKKRDKVEVRSAKLKEDGRTVVLDLGPMQPVMQMHIKCDLESKDGKEIVIDIWNTVNRVPEGPSR
jgi:hypothetical protein